MSSYYGEATSPGAVQLVLEEIRYKPGWRFEVDLRNARPEFGGMTVYLSVHIRTTDSTVGSGGKEIEVEHRQPIPPGLNSREEIIDWLFGVIVQIETHEACEFFRVEGGAVVPYHPHKQHGRAYGWVPLASRGQWMKDRYLAGKQGNWKDWFAPPEANV